MLLNVYSIFLKKIKTNLRGKWLNKLQYSDMMKYSVIIDTCYQDTKRHGCILTAYSYVNGVKLK